MLKSISLFLLPLCLIAGGCATGYHSEGLIGGGYSEIKKGPDVYFVTFTGNEYTPAEKMQQYVLTRSAELTLENGYHYFSIITSYDKMQKHQIREAPAEEKLSETFSLKDPDLFPVASHVKSKNTGSYASETICQPRLTLEIKCYHERPEGKDAIDAASFMIQPDNHFLASCSIQNS